MTRSLPHSFSRAHTTRLPVPIMVPAREGIVVIRSTEEEQRPFPSSAGTQESQDGLPRSLQGKRAVIVEDEGITQLQLRRTLTRAGLTVVGTANDGQSGVETVLRERPDIVLMDISMPVMNGLDAACRILQEYRVCIVMLTAYATEEYERRAREAGVAGYIHKPIVSATLFHQLQQAWQRFRPN